MMPFLEETVPMLSRRWSRPLLTMVTVLLAFASSVALFVPVQADAIGADRAPEIRAQLGGSGLVSVAIWTCDVVRAADVVTLTTSFYKPDGAYPCEDGLPDGTSLTIDGVAPDLITATNAIWFTVLYGPHTLSAGAKSTPLQFDLESTSVAFYALYERAQGVGGWAEVHVKDCAVAPVGQTVIVDSGDDTPAGFSVCVDGNLEKRDYGLLVNGQKPTYWGSSSASWQLTNGNYVMTADGGGRYAFPIQNWTVVVTLYTKGEVTSLPPDGGSGTPPVDELPNTGAGTVGTGSSNDRDAMLPVALLIASVALGYVSFRVTCGTRQ